MHVKVKICGITNLEDALATAEAGADYLGFIFYPPSRRAISVAAAQAITADLRRAAHCPALVGVFVDETADAMAHILDTCRLDLAQLSGSEPPALIGEPASPLYGRAYKALRPTSFTEAEVEAEWYMPPQFSVFSEQFSVSGSPPLHRSPAPALLIDSYHPTLPGGTGQTGDWSLAARLAQKVPGLMLAGGLTADNVAEAVRQVRPFAVDVASGVEAASGKKDHGLVRAFIANATKTF
jgi:phosphoribosylanthranilate isomerase